MAKTTGIRRPALRLKGWRGEDGLKQYLAIRIFFIPSFGYSARIWSHESGKNTEKEKGIWKAKLEVHDLQHDLVDILNLLYDSAAQCMSSLNPPAFLLIKFQNENNSQNNATRQNNIIQV